MPARLRVTLFAVLYSVLRVLSARAQTNCSTTFIAPGADLRHWLANGADDQPQAFSSALRNDLMAQAPCMWPGVNVSNLPYDAYDFGQLTQIMLACTDASNYPARSTAATSSSSLVYSPKTSFSQSACTCADDNGQACKNALKPISTDCWNQALLVLCSYDIRSVVVGASLEAVYAQLVQNTTKQCVSLQSKPVLDCATLLQTLQDPRTDIRINDVANGSANVRAPTLLALLLGSLVALVMSL